MASIFTRIIKGEIPAHVIAENEQFIAFLDIHPLRRGHTLIVPKQEIDYIFELPEQLLSAVMPFAGQVAKKIEKVIPCARIGVTVIGLEVPHAHVHLIPIDSVSDMNFARPKLDIPPDEMAEIARLIRNA